MGGMEDPDALLLIDRELDINLFSLHISSLGSETVALASNRISFLAYCSFFLGYPLLRFSSLPSFFQPFHRCHLPSQ